ncbi:3-oxoacyl-[acyl-carrier protein] reductase [Ochrobactrum daejeonense]|uniref:3-oxoacyl-[acyl-carrier protein] reductase n=1 Tax=Brucella daejeonensis TaxID=659015 RepID=A0A7W9AZ41_9HYPH|nr:SDR family oxidoreductase [Brucella daejeonensis]MBB5703254.1 3-oxoacyl-[acyl-carrier protein] reductase [Brucella daejeonensis]
MKLKDKTAIVTGAGKGIGAEIARQLAREGVAVTVNYARDENAARQVVLEIERAGGRAVAVQADIGAPAGMPAVFDAAEAAFGPVDILVNNAGLMRLSSVADATDKDIEDHCAINLAGTFRGMREGARRLRDGGRIISISSSVVGFYQPGYGLYAATKAGVEALTHVLAKELGARRITVNAIAPGPVETDLFLNGKSEELVANITRMIPLGRLGRPEDIAESVVFLAGPESGWINGQTIRANGGAI